MSRVVRSVFLAALVLLNVLSVFAQQQDSRLKDAYRFERDQWIYVHLQGSPANIGFQHGYLLSDEIKGALEAMKTRTLHDTKREWAFYRKTAQDILWPHTDAEFQQELQGIADGAKAKGVSADVWDIVALNSMEEVPDYYVPWLDKQEKRPDPPSLHSPGNCSAFVATGGYTKDGKIVIAHNNWTGVYQGARWRIIFDIVPQKGNRILMDGYPGVITSDDDFGVNSSGLAVTETTITQFNGYDPNGKPEFVRSRKAMQYANSIDDYVAIMLDGNNGGYANDWLIADNKTGEIARFELGLKHHKLWRTKDGYFHGSNWAADPELIKDETTFDPNNKSSSPNARKIRWEQLIEQNKGKIDVGLAQQFLSDHLDTYQNKEEANERTLCGHVEASPRGIPEWDWNPFYPGGAVQGKAADSSMVKAMTFTARRGHPCGADFDAKEFLDKHPEYAWEKDILPDMKAGPWSRFTTGEKQ
jgi:Phospholipase B